MNERLRYFDGQIKLAYFAKNEKEIQHSLNVITNFKSYLAEVIKNDKVKAKYMNDLDNLSYKLIERLNNEKNINGLSSYQKVHKKAM